MKLIIGARASGKRAYARERFGLIPRACTPEEALVAPAVMDFHETIKTLCARGSSVDDYLNRLFSLNPDVLILCNEVGMGIVPMDSGERFWREEVGRACCLIAARADTVVRMVCGLPQVLKEGSDSVGE